MEGCMKDSIKMIRNMVMEFTLGQTLRGMQDGGAMESSTA
jgi:hypothetical protein